MKHESNGFSAIEALLVLILLTVVGFGGYWVWSKNKPEGTANVQQDTANAIKQDDSTNPEGSQSASEEALVQYSLSRADVSFSYPKDWKISTKTDLDERTFEKVILTAPDNSEIRITVFKFLGGFTGDEPYESLDDVVTASNGQTKYALLTTKEDGKYITSSLTQDPDGKYKTGGSIQALPRWFSVSLSDGTKVQMAVTFSGPGDEDYGQSQVYEDLTTYKSLAVYQEATRFMEHFSASAE